MPWKTRKRGTKRQVGKHFFVDEKGDKRDLPRGMKIVSVPEHSELRKKFREEIQRTKDAINIDDEEEEPEEIIPSVPTDEEIIEAGVEELLEKGSPEEIEALLGEPVEPIRRRKHRTTEKEVDWTEIARRKRALKRHPPTIEHH